MYKKVIVGLWILFGLITSVYWLRIGGTQTVVIRDTLYLLMPFVAVISGVFALSVFGTKGFRAKTLMLLTCGLSSWFVGELLFYFYEFVLRTNPFPSVADIFYLLAYPLIFYALVNEIGDTKTTIKKIHPPIIFFFSLAAIALAVIVLYFGVYQAFDPQASFLTNVIAMEYGIGDLLLIIANMCVLTLAWEFRGGRLSKVWVLLFIGFIFMMIADVLFAKYNTHYDNEEWLYRSILDTTWMLSYAFFASGLFRFGFSVLEAKEKLFKRKKITKD